MVLRITGILVIAVMNGYFNSKVAGYCPEDSESLERTEPSGMIEINIGKYTTCTWSLPTRSKYDYFLVLNFTDIYIPSGQLTASAISVLQMRTRPFCAMFYSTSACPKRKDANKYNECNPTGIVIALPTQIKLDANTARFTMHYDFVSCRGTTQSTVITNQISAIPKTDHTTVSTTEQNIMTNTVSASAGTPNANDNTADDGLTASPSTLPFVISIVILVILLLISFTIILLLNHRLRMAKADHLESMVRFTRNKEPQAQASPVFPNEMDVGPYATIANQQPRVEESRHRGGGVGEQAQTQQATGYASVNVNASQYATIEPKQQRINASYTPDADAGSQPAQRGEIASSNAPSSSCVYATVNKPPK